LATPLQNLLNRQQAITDELAALASTPDDSPNVQGGGAGTVDHTGKIKSLYDELERINKLIAVYQGPVERAMIVR
jgi:hypothetical protein